MIDNFFKIISKHYLYKDTYNKLNILKQDPTFLKNFENYKNIYNLEMQQNYNVLDIIASSDKNLSLNNEGKKFKLNNRIDTSKDSTIIMELFYSSKFVNLNREIYLKNNFQLYFNYENDSGDIETTYSIKFFFENSQYINKLEQFVHIEIIDYNSLPNKKDYSIGLFNSDRKLDVDTIILNDNTIFKTNPLSVEFVNNFEFLYRCYPELKNFNLSQLESLILNGGLFQEDLDILNLSNDLNPSLFEGYILKEKLNIFEILSSINNKKTFKINNC